MKFLQTLKCPWLTTHLKQFFLQYKKKWWRLYRQCTWGSGVMPLRPGTYVLGPCVLSTSPATPRLGWARLCPSVSVCARLCPFPSVSVCVSAHRNITTRRTEMVRQDASHNVTLFFRSSLGLGLRGHALLDVKIEQ